MIIPMAIYNNLATCPKDCQECLLSCPEKAIAIVNNDEISGIVMDIKICTGCLVCVDYCPIGNISVKKSS